MLQSPMYLINKTKHIIHVFVGSYTSISIIFRMKKNLKFKIKIYNQCNGNSYVLISHVLNNKKINTTNVIKHPMDQSPLCILQM
jgi:hypothetical protein